MCTRFPKLKIAPVENGSGWVRPLLHDMESAYTFNPHLFERTRWRCSSGTSSCTLPRGRPRRLCGVIGADNVLFGSDSRTPKA